MQSISYDDLVKILQAMAIQALVAMANKPPETELIIIDNKVQAVKKGA